MSIYKIKENDTCISPANEKDQIPIDAENLLDGKCAREVLIHPSNDNQLCISPNNAAFRINFNSPLVSFFACSIVTYEKHKRIMICLYFLFHTIKKTYTIYRI